MAPKRTLLSVNLDELQLVNLEMRIGEGRIDALRELRLDQHPYQRLNILDAFWHQYCSKVPLKTSSVLGLLTDTIFRSGTQVGDQLAIAPVRRNSRLAVSKGCSKCR